MTKETDISFPQNSQAVEDLKANFLDYIARFGNKNCPHIPREEGEDVSLLVELVEKNTHESLFDKATSSKKQ